MSKSQGKPRRSLTLSAGQRKQLADAVALVEEHVARIADVWPSLSAEQRQAVLSDSPLLARIVALTEVLR